MNLSRFVHTLLLVGSVALAYIWVSYSALNQYAVQAFALSVLGYFLIKHFKKSKIWHILPDKMSSEMAIITFSFLLIIGHTGNLHSFLYPLTFVHLFFLVLTSENTTAVVGTLAITLFHYALTPVLNNIELSNLVSIPIISIFFLFAKEQYNQTWKNKLIIRQEEREIAVLKNENHEIERFLEIFINQRIKYMQKLSDYPLANKQIIQKQLKDVQKGLDEMLAKIDNDLK
ncbi:MAG: hypothetical protein ACOZAN_04445 [Patescibacteria group bacterium]